MGDMDDNAAGELIDAVTDAALEAIARILHLNVDSMTEPQYFDLAISCATHILVHFHQALPGHPPLRESLRQNDTRVGRCQPRPPEQARTRTLATPEPI
jgi:hypothetical protein